MEMYVILTLPNIWCNSWMSCTLSVGFFLCLFSLVLWKYVDFLHTFLKPEIKQAQKNLCLEGVLRTSRSVHSHVNRNRAIKHASTAGKRHQFLTNWIWFGITFLSVLFIWISNNNKCWTVISYNFKKNIYDDTWREKIRVNREVEKGHSFRGQMGLTGWLQRENDPRLHNLPLSHFVLWQTSKLWYLVYKTFLLLNFYKCKCWQNY